MRAMLAAAALGLAAVPQAAHADVAVQYFTPPAELTGSASALAAGGGSVFFGIGDGFNQEPWIVTLNPAAAVPGTANGMTYVKTPDAPGCCSSIFREFSWSDTDKQLYWTRSDSTIGKFANGIVTARQLTAQPWGIAAAGNGGAFVAEYSDSNSPPYNGNRVSTVNAALDVAPGTNLALQTGSWDGTRYDAKVKGVAVAPDGRPWFTENAPTNNGYRIGSGVGPYQEFRPCPTAALCSEGRTVPSGLNDIEVAADGTVWYTNDIKNAIGRFVPGTNAYTEFALSSFGLAGGSPRSIRKAPDGTLWFTVGGGGANAVVSFKPAETPTFTAYKLGAANAPFEVAPAANGDVWFTGNPGAGGTVLGRLTGATTVTPPVTETPDPGTPTTPAVPGTTPVTPITTTVAPVISSTAKLTDPTVKGDNLSLNQICVGPPSDPCSLVYLLQTREYVKGFPGAKSAAAKLTTIGQLKVTLKGGQSKQVTLKLNAKGRKLRKKLKSFKATLTVTQTVKGTKKPKQVLKKNVTFKRGG